ncbi:hypothetical protein M9H77_07731 [Catharanthus roseus]|uniref:Uncharacterized protein n=1 Tax=Catharanthus roseus TaxID=4058 RepID=A0ACC0BW24_CATRO|nr:hypothetical protein M9H77_07731 [Catharanthus roseus]
MDSYRSDPKRAGGYNFLATLQNLMMPVSKKAVGNLPHFMERLWVVSNFPHNIGIMGDFHCTKAKFGKEQGQKAHYLGQGRYGVNESGNGGHSLDGFHDNSAGCKLKVLEPKAFGREHSAKKTKNFLWDFEKYFKAAKALTTPGISTPKRQPKGKDKEGKRMHDNDLKNANLPMKKTRWMKHRPRKPQVLLVTCRAKTGDPSVTSVKSLIRRETAP